MITSPILADHVLRPVDDRIAGACRKAGLIYTRYVDDIALSGQYDLNQNRGIGGLVARIIANHGFDIHPHKGVSARCGDDIAITGVRIKQGRRFDVTKQYIYNLMRQLEDVARLAQGGRFEGPYYTRDQIHGRVQFACWVNPGRKGYLMKRFRSIPWQNVERVARQRGLVRAGTRLMAVK